MDGEGKDEIISEMSKKIQFLTLDIEEMREKMKSLNG